MTPDQPAPEEQQTAYWRSIEAAHAPWQPLSSISCPADFDETLKAQLIKHGCTCQQQSDHLLVIFPAGTLMHEILPRCLEARWRVILPDGLLLMRQQMRQRIDPAHDLKDLLFAVE